MALESMLLGKLRTYLQGKYLHFQMLEQWCLTQICSAWPININVVLYLFCQISGYSLLLMMGELNGEVRGHDLPRVS